VSRSGLTTVQILELVAKKDRRINALICSKCHVGVFRPHHEYPQFQKCELCGFTEKSTSDSLKTRLPVNPKF